MLRSEIKSVPVKGTLISLQPFHDGYIAGVYYDPIATEFHITVSELHTKKIIFEFEPIKEEREFGNMKLLLLSDRRVLAHQMNNKAHLFHLDGTVYKCKVLSAQKFHKIELGDPNTLIAEHSIKFKTYFSILDDKSLEEKKSKSNPSYPYWTKLPSGEFVTFESKVDKRLEAYAEFYKNAMDEKPYKSISLQYQYAIDPVAISDKIIAYKSNGNYVLRNIETGKTCEIRNTTFYDLIFTPLPDKKTLLVSDPYFYILDHHTHTLSLANITAAKGVCKSIALSMRSGVVAASSDNDEIVIFSFAKPAKELMLFGRSAVEKPRSDEHTAYRANTRDPKR